MPINWKGITTTGNRYYDAKKIAALNDSLQYLPIKQRAAVLGSIIEESGGDPMAKSDNGTYQGLLQWGADRYRIQSNNPQEELARQLETLRNTIDNTEDKKSWTHGGTGSGYNSGKEAYQDFSDSISPLDPTFRAFSFGYVRPKGKEASYSNRLKVAQQVYDRLYEDEQNRNAKYTPSTNFEDYQYKPNTQFSQGGTLNTTPWDHLTLAEQAAMMKVAVQNGIYNLHDIRQKYNEFAEGGSKEEEEEVNTDDYSVGNLVDALYQTNPKEEYLGEPSHHYDFTQSEEWADAHGYYPDARGHRDDRVKKPAHPSHPSRGTWDGDKFILTDLGMQTPNYTMFGLIDGGQDPQAILTYKGGVVLPEITVSPQGNYFFNPYDNIELHTKAHGGSIHIKPENRGKFTALKERTGHSATWFKEHGTPAQKKMATFALNARHWNHALGGNLYDGTTQPTQQMVIHKPYYDLDNTLHYNIDFPEVVITPDSKLSPAERNYRERQRQKNQPDYAEQKAREYTGIQQLAAQKEWENSTEKTLLDYAQAAATGVGIGADIVSGLPIYSSLKGARVLSEAQTPMEYAEGALWLAPIMKTTATGIYDKVNHLYNNIQDLQALKKFNARYGYTAVKPKNTLVFDDDGLDRVFDHVVKRHNTFVRGVDPFEAFRQGRLTNMTPEEAAKYSLTHIPKAQLGNNAGLLAGENGLYVSNDFPTAAGYANEGSGYVGIVRRPIKYGQPTRREFLADNDFVFSRPPGKARQFFTTSDEPNIPWITKNFNLSDSPPINWRNVQPFEVRANAGARVIEKGDPDFRHYIFVGDIGEEPVELLEMYKPTTYGTKAHKGIGAVGLSRKKNLGGVL